MKVAAVLTLGALIHGGARRVAADPAAASVPASASVSAAAPAAASTTVSASVPASAPASVSATAAASGASGAAGAQGAKQRYVVAAMGDSLTDAKSHGGKFLDYLREKCPQSQFDNYGKGGQMVNQMRKRFAADVLGEPAPEDGSPAKPAYTHVIIFGGVNDLYSDLTAKRTPKLVEKDLLWMYEQTKSHGAKVVAVTVAPWGGFTRYYNASRGQSTITLNRWIRDQKKAGTADYVIDAYSLLSCGNPEHLCPAYKPPFKDGLHFGTEGHKKLGEALYTKVFSGCL